MQKTIMVVIVGFLLIGVTVFAQDVSIDANGNITTGSSNSNGGNLEVTGGSAEDAIVGIAGDAGGAGVYGVQPTNGDFGLLGGYNSKMHPVGVYGFSQSPTGHGVYGENTAGGYAGYFNGPVEVNGIITGYGSGLKDLNWDSLINVPEGFADGQDGDCDGVPCELTSSLISNCTKVGADLYGVLYCSPEILPVWSINGSDAYYNSGNVGIGTSTPSEKLTVDGIIESSSGGIKFPDGTIQTSASSASLTYLRTVIVSPVLGDAIASGTALLSALAGITGATSTNPYLLKIEPGIYDLGNNGLTMQPFVDIEGSGENTTTISSTHSSGGVLDQSSATVVGSNNAEIRFLTVENLGGSTYAVAIYNNSASPKITNVTATASGGTYNYGVYNLVSSSPSMTNVTATALMGSASIGVANFTSSSPTMTNVTITASGGSSINSGISNWLSSPTMMNVTVTASGGTDSYGVSNANSSSPIMTAMIATASGGSNSNYGVSNSANSSPTLKEVSSNGIVINGNRLFVPAISNPYNNGALLKTVYDVIAGLGLPSETNRYVIKLDAGIYDLVDGGLWTQNNVDIEGSGENSTTITLSPPPDGNQYSTLYVRHNVEIRFLTVEHICNNLYGTAINIMANPLYPYPIKITNVTAKASGANAVNYAIQVKDSSPIITNVTAIASGGTGHNYGILTYDTSSPVMTNVTAIASGGTSNNIGIYNDIIFTAGAINSPTMTNVTAIASGGTNSTGVMNEDSSPTMTNVTATASGGSNLNRGIASYNSSVTMTNVTVTASGGTSSYGVWDQNSNTIMTAVIATASSGTTDNEAVHIWDSTVEITHSKLKGEYSLYSALISLTLVANTELNGMVYTGPSATTKCAGVFDGTFTFYPTTCL